METNGGQLSLEHFDHDKVVFGHDRPLSRVVKAKAGSSHTLTWTAWVHFPPSPTHDTCLLCSAMSGLMKLACLFLDMIAHKLDNMGI